MTLDSSYELSSSDSVDVNSGEPLNNVNTMTDFTLDFLSDEVSDEVVSSKQRNRHSFLVKQRIEDLQEERRLRKFDEDYFSDWD
ncbi:PA3496 family putative envelope integrity protein [Colwellia ponticola]|uniref:Uncharacterized protein n=1 Tax=Colwellia ponticola TaxID=2304625 RepID=A0A8H2PJ89_9GAMM|nr:hypothetical protein [Colwellia ponticola]TMM42509.1 hypothetical protein FCS21_14280 [Colwellia ponticola]